MISLKKVTSEDVYDTIHNFVIQSGEAIVDYEGMVEIVLTMIQKGYCFTVDRDTLRDAMECLTFMYCPSDDMNRDRVVQQLVDEGDESDEESDEEGFGNMDLMKMMQVMGAPPAKPASDGSDCPEPKQIVTEETTCSEESPEPTVVKKE